ncbi:NmrA family protein [Xylona heveae TC161]|uniref:NmrA family protein n=1 Tax=Xylona heveae (strain CBS 132557 / TC161) TaxID=1328760 RepID=A0A165HW31_XYLHT|nr:NmrA family protein [Xylona heveae TC161]KZF24004.1 NmrA family protein [Xylona heveae TC161]
MASKILVIGGTGAQGMPIIQALVQDKKYSCRVLTRDVASARAKYLASLGNVELVEGTFANEHDLRRAYHGCDGAFVNIDGFNCGEKAEIFWAIRCYELAIEAGVVFYVYANLDYAYKKSGYNPLFRAGHYDGKGRVAEFILAQNSSNKDNNDNKNGNNNKNNNNDNNGKMNTNTLSSSGSTNSAGTMGVAAFTTGPYIEMTIGANTPMTPSIEEGDDDGNSAIVTWRVPLGDGAVPHVALDDCGYYVRWLFDHPERAHGMDLEVAIEHIRYADLARAFEKVTGHPARYVDVSLEEYWDSGPMAGSASRGTGYNADPEDAATMSIKDNFTGFWNMWKYSGGNVGVIQRDYALLDEIFPSRIKSAEEWFRREDELGRKSGKGSLWERVQKGNLKPVMKLVEDRLSGRL